GVDHLHAPRGQGLSLMKTKREPPDGAAGILFDLQPRPGQRPQDGEPSQASAKTLPDAGFLRKHGGWFDLVWLIYSCFFFIQPIQVNKSREWIIFACAYSAFLALYLGIIRAPTRRFAFSCMAGMGVLGLAYIPYNQSAAGIMVYVVAFAPFVAESVALSIGIFAAVSL